MTWLKNKPDRKTYIIQTTVAVLIIAAILVIDLVTKTVAEADHLSWPGGSLTVIEGFFYIRFTKNTGAAWSIGGDSKVFMTIVIILTFIVVAAFLAVIFYPDKRKNLLLVVSLALITSGAVGNLVDRLYLGYVRDFLATYPFGRSFPVFNVADMSLVVGVIVMIVCLIVYFFKPAPKEQPEDAAKEQAENAETKPDDAGDGV